MVYVEKISKFMWRIYDPKDGQWAEVSSTTGDVNQRGPGPFSIEMAMVIVAMGEGCRQGTRQQEQAARHALPTK